MLECRLHRVRLLKWHFKKAAFHLDWNQRSDFRGHRDRLWPFCLDAAYSELCIFTVMGVNNVSMPNDSELLGAGIARLGGLGDTPKRDGACIIE